KNYATSAPADLGFSPEQLAEERPGTIYCSVRAMATTGPGPIAGGSTWRRSASRASPISKAQLIGPSSLQQGDERLHRRLHGRCRRDRGVDSARDRGRQLPRQDLPHSQCDVVSERGSSIATRFPERAKSINCSSPIP